MGDWSGWYDALVKPSWTPAPGVIGTIWTVLYPIIIVTFGAALVGIAKGDLPKIVLVPVLLNATSNVAFTPILFGMRNLPLATADILVVLVTIVWVMILVWPTSRWMALALVPYLAWVGTATTLQISITVANR